MSIHDLTDAEKELSKLATKELCFEVVIYHDGRWICDPLSPQKKMGFGDTWRKAVMDCLQNNTEER